MALIDDVVVSTSLAATAPPAAARDAVSWAASAGAAAARRGSLLPLPLLLDVRAVWDRPRDFFFCLRRSRPFTDDQAQYVDWLREFCTAAPDWLLPTVGRQRRRGLAPGIGVVQLLVAVWPSLPGSPLDTVSAFSALDSDDLADSILARWSAEREESPSQWLRWFPSQAKPMMPPAAGLMWSLFAEAEGTEWLDERFDHEAARVYLDAHDPKLSPEQQRRIQRLQRRRPSSESVPFADAYVEPDPYSGAIMIATLAAGETGELKIVNRSDPRVSNPPPALPPRPFDVHLHWGHAASGLASDIEAPRYRDSNEPDRLVSAASLLQGFVALVLDDWRFAVRQLPIHFHLHCGVPNPERDRLGLGGPRWKDVFKGGKADPPPLQVVGRLFRRCSWLRLSAVGFSWGGVLFKRGWFCAVLLETDLREFGFEPRFHDWYAESLWTAGQSALPTCMDTVFLLAPERASGRVLSVRRLTERGGLVLLPVARHPSETKGADPSYLELRSRALDTLLDALEGVLR